MKHTARFDTATQDDNAALFAKRRAAIDLIATLRAKTQRVSLYGNYLFRLHPTDPENEETRAQWRSVLEEMLQDVDRVRAITSGRDPNDEIPKEVCVWIAQTMSENPENSKVLSKNRDLTHDILSAAQANNQTELGYALEAHRTYIVTHVYKCVTAFCDGLWQSLDRIRKQEVNATQVSAAKISETLSRLEHIGKHVRLVSLNASVEAARAGPAGKGLGVIAVEFKTLSEEIQRLAVTAGDDIRKMAAMDGR